MEMAHDESSVELYEEIKSSDLVDLEEDRGFVAALKAVTLVELVVEEVVAMFDARKVDLVGMVMEVEMFVRNALYHAEPHIPPYHIEVVH